jgi:uncharacterized protein
MHRRLKPFGHRFVYRVLSVLVDIDAPPRLALFSHNRFNLFSFHDRDHGRRDGTALRPWIEALLGRNAIDVAGGRIMLHCFPRVLGFVFNPISLYWCWDRAGRLAAVLCEVKNTFGQQHCYLLKVAGARADGAPIRVARDKAFYVSPFIAMECRYHFKLHEPDARLRIAIRQTDARGDLLVATHTGRRVELTNRALLAAFLAMPLVTLKVVAGIHWEAVKLWWKGGRLQPRPAPPIGEVS